MIQPKYRINILWSQEDQCFLVELPEFANQVQRYFSHGNTYEEAMTNAREVLELLIESYKAEGKELPVGWAMPTLQSLISKDK